MAVYEQGWGTRSRDTNTITRRYRIDDASDDNEAFIQLGLALPATLNDIPLDTDSVKVEEGDDGNYVGFATWTRKEPNSPPEGTCSIQFESTATTVHISHSIETINYWGGNPPPPTGAIGITDSGDIDGVDIYAPDEFAFTITKTFAAGDVGSAYIETLRSCACKVNASEITIWGMTFAAGELLFKEWTGGQSKSGEVELHLKFLSRENRTGIVIDDITGITKKGWHYLHARYAPEADDTSHTLVPKAIGAYEEQVYYTTDLSVLDICETNPWEPEEE